MSMHLEAVWDTSPKIRKTFMFIFAVQSLQETEEALDRTATRGDRTISLEKTGSW